MISHSAHRRRPQLANPIAESHPTVWIKTNIARWQRILYAKCSTGTFPKNDRYEIAGSRTGRGPLRIGAPQLHSRALTALSENC